ncbi:MAG: UDP-N-acetylmuramoyl-L-alanyl-D-glutamate--2,6-diaminopimelate ligase [Turicibacter sp.]|nr:UDP-N-acetylmuramoyl-L-alanyl-D-glutamate--2,6-diaminopimelate ligase [Turicibacter sp.]
MNLSQLSQILDQPFKGADIDIAKLAYDSRKVGPGTVFFAIKGEDHDGHRYVGDAIANGAIAIVGEDAIFSEVPYFRVPSAKKALARLSDAFYGRPSKKLHLVGVTGTNGKTTITYLIRHVYLELGLTSGLIGTNEWDVVTPRPATHTTPMGLELNEMLLEGFERGVSHVAMEVSSHGIKENRVDQIDFDRFIFTNITSDHMDYHPSFEDYLFTKMRPFAQFNDYGTDKAAIINYDDPYGAYFLSACNSRTLTYGLNELADFCAREIIMGMESTSFSLYVKGRFVGEVAYPLFGKYNIYNVLAVLGYFYSLGYDLMLLIPIIGKIPIVDGRSEVLETAGNRHIIIDYAHNPGAVREVLTSLKQVAGGKIITVIGAGGHRDKGKRAVMGAYALELSSHVVFTSDNPRDEDPLDIIRDLASGSALKNYDIVLDRAEAIERALMLAQNGDYVAILGKGHEKTQNINGKIIPFSDKIVVEEVIRKRGI